MSFTPQQAALIAEPGHALALAGPGSGKTSTVIEKMAQLLRQPGNRVVACSFSRESAEEIRRRLIKRMGEDQVAQADVRIGTFHSLIAEHRKTHGRDTKMISPAQQYRTLAGTASDHGENISDVLPQFEEIKYGLIPPDPTQLPPWFKDYEAHLKTLQAIDLQDLIRLSVLQMSLSVTLPHVPEGVDENECSMPIKLAIASVKYRAEMRARCEELKSLAHRLGEQGNHRGAERARASYRYIINQEGALPLLGATHLICDESQDNDELQFALATLHALTGVPTTLIGDDDQTIYEWRRAMGYPGLMSFAKTFDAKVITLGANFRSLRSVVEHADKLIRHNEGHRVEKTFRAMRGAGGHITAERADSRTIMLMTAVAYVGSFVSPFDGPSKRFTQQVQTGEFGVLGRNNFILDSLEAGFLEAGFKYIRQGQSILKKEGALFLYDVLGSIYAADIKGISVVLHVKGVSTRTAEKVCREILGNHSLFVDGLMTNYAAFGDDATAVEDCAKWFLSCREQARKGIHSGVINEAAEIVKQMYYSDADMNPKSFQNLRAVNAVRTTLKRMTNESVVQRVSTLMNSDDNTDTSNAISLMTFHGSKGLEFNKVIIVGADEKSSPGKGELMSERRLFYVAITRAKDIVLALYTGTPSRYLREMGLV